ncbi:hypothetical protein MNBD_ALPHA06-2242 [hydrothermal vent metagenome]|uniref:Colicin V production protein n=1 Tax=hydrothermal vent metagenome TaxID=652676 RepID=A0A3B0SME5_9ZZZZ
MDANPATILDVIAFGVLALSSLFALARGFIRESLSIASFVVASLATIFTHSIFNQVTMRWIESEIIASVVTAAVIFLGVYVLMTFATRKISDFARRNPHISVLDRTAGFAFGLVRGMVMLALVLLGWNFVAKPEQTPDWIATTKVYPAVTATAEILKSLAPNSRASSIQIPDLIKNAASDNKMSAPPKPEQEQGYDQTDRSILDQVVTTKLDGEKQAPPPPENETEGDTPDE